MQHFLITVRIRRGSSETVREILREGPPFDLSETSLERHSVFLTGDELAFLFEGHHAEDEAGRLLSRPDVFGQASRLATHFAGRPRLPQEVFSWSRPERLDGVDFGPLPGPGDSEGGPID
jgi:hypothetical protein